MHFSPLFLLQSLLSLFRSPEFSALPRGKILTTDVITYYTPHLMGWYDNDHLIVRLFPSRSLVQWFVGWLDCRLDGSLVRWIVGSMDFRPENCKCFGDWVRIKVVNSNNTTIAQRLYTQDGRLSVSSAASKKC